MAARDALNREITPQVLLKAYSCGIFPMAESADDPQLYWIEPVSRGILPLDDVRLPKRLARTLRQQPFDVRDRYRFQRDHCRLRGFPSRAPINLDQQSDSQLVR